MIRAIFFDLDGVLTTKFSGSYTTFEYLVEKTGISLERFLAAYSGFQTEIVLGEVSWEEVWPKICQELGEDIDFSLVLEAFESTPMNKQLLLLAKELKEKYTLGIITDNNAQRFNVISTRHNLNELFPFQICSGDVGSSKWSVEIFENALFQAGVKATETVFIDNREKSLVCANKLGMNTILFDATKETKKDLLRKLKMFNVNV